jgi:hypothetical protein
MANKKVTKVEVAGEVFVFLRNVCSTHSINYLETAFNSLNKPRHKKNYNKLSEK